ncbi:MAG TPA: hypothetical protein VFG51_03990 [Candidatus Saccharimonadia bacterium]|nr:hypothetical protein [Candidatus Saccharimonadia bacterium]
MIDDENQTVFAQEEPMIEHQTAGDVPTGVAGAAIPKKKMGLAKFAVIVIGIMFVLLILVGLAAKRSPVQRAGTPSPSPSAGTNPQAQSELETTLNLLHEDVAKADPSINDLPIPPLNYKLTLDTGN